MSFYSFARFFGNWRKKWSRRASRRSSAARPARRRSSLLLEILEDRTVPAGLTAPSILSVSPSDGQVLGNSPANIQVVFSDLMKFDNTAHTGAAGTASYLLVDSTGTALTLTGATAANSGGHTTATLTFSGSLAGTYTLYVHGDQLFSATTNLPIAPSGQLIVANTGSNSLETVNLESNGTLGAVSQYSAPGGGGVSAVPSSVYFSDLNQDGRPDLLVANQSTNTVSIFLGQGAAAGYNFAPTPDLVLNLPVGAQPSAIAVGDFSGDTLPDIAVANSATNNVSVFVQNSGTFSFKSVGNVAAGTGPVALVAADLNGDGKTDLAVASSGSATVTLLQGKGNGTFTSSTVSLSVTAPTGMALGDLDGDGAKDLAVSGSNGIQVLINSSSVASVNFTPQGSLAYTANTVSLDIGAAAGASDIVASTSNGLVDLINNGSAVFTPVVVNIAAGSATRLVDLNNDNVNEILVTSSGTPDVLNILQKVSLSGAVSDASNTGPIVITSPSHGLSSGMGVTITGVNGNTAANGNFIVTVIDADHFSLNGSTGNGTYVSGGTWTAATYAPANGSPYDVGTGGGALAIGDVNNDGNPDVAITNGPTGDVIVYYGAGDRTLRQAQPIALTPTETSAVATGDVNGDNFPDLVAVNYNASTSQTFVSVALGVGDGTYGTPVDYPVSSDIRTAVSVAIGDLNGDGQPDIVFADQGDSHVGILQNNISTAGGGLTAGSFTPVASLPVGTIPSEVVLADVNHDGKLDVVVAHDGGNNSKLGGVSVVLNQNASPGAFAFGAAAEYATGTVATALTVADFNRDGNPDIAVLDGNTAVVKLLLGDGAGNFTNGGSFDAGVAFPVAVASADLNLDGYPDLVVASDSTSAGQGGVSVLLSQFGTGFGSALQTTVAAGTPWRSVVVTDLNQDGKPDVLVSSDAGSFYDNVFVLYGAGDGTFTGIAPYLAGAPSNDPVPPAGGTTSPPTNLALTSNPLERVATFVVTSTTVNPNLIVNGGFESHDLSNAPGSLLGWSTYDLPGQPGGSHGHWAVQTGTSSPISGATVPKPTGTYRAMLDEADLVPIAPNGSNSNTAVSYEGSHFLYQNVTIPANATQVTLSLSLYLNNSASDWSNTTTNPSLNYLPDTTANQQVRVDIMSPGSSLLSTSTGILKQIFITAPGGAKVHTYQLSADLSAYAGQTVQLRIAAVNNQGKLIVGVDNVSITAKFTDATDPTLTGIGLRNPGVTVDGLPATTDSTIIGQVADNGSVNNIAYVQFATSTATYKVTNWDANGNFAFTLPGLAFGQNDITITAVDNAGNQTFTTFSFVYQGASSQVWQAYGPNAISTLGIGGVDYKSVTGRVTSIAVDPTDPSSNTIYVGSDNGGVWKTTDGGANWTPLTDHVTDSNNQPVFTPIGALAVTTETDPQNSQNTLDVVYAGLGVADNQFNSRPGSGILKSTDGGQTWTVLGETDFANARISKIVIDSTHPDTVYVAVASGGAAGPGVYRSTDGGTTWSNILSPSNMYVANSNTTLASIGVSLIANVTDLVVDPFDSTQLLVGLGNIGLADKNGTILSTANPNATAGLWRTADGGTTWVQQIGGTNGGGQLPSGTGVGRITIAVGNGRRGDEAISYYLVGMPPPAGTAAPTVNNGGYLGLYTSQDGLSTFTNVLLEQNTGSAALPAYSPIDLLNVDGAYAGALAVDPSNPFVVYVGGSSRYNSGSALNHMFIRVDTGNMITASSGAVTHAGDDAQKAAAGVGSFYDAPANTDAYVAEGVSWFDIAENSSNGLGGENLLPQAIHSLVFSPSGQLLIGTEGGLWRGTSYGFKYDYSSGGNGILGGKAPKMNGMTLVSLNNNLQITDLTSAAVNPTDPTQISSTQVGLGAAAASGLLNWYSTGLSYFGVPTASQVFASPVVPGTLAGSSVTLYRNWEFANANTFLPQFSQDNGQTWNTISTNGITTTSPSDYFPGFLMQSQLIYNSGLYQNVLLLGTDRVYRTNTSSVQWTTIGPSAPLTDFLTGQAITGQITALAVGNAGSGIVESATGNGAVTITSLDHNLKTGDQVTVNGLQYLSPSNKLFTFNGTYKVTVVSKDLFTLNGATVNGTYVTGGGWSKVVSKSGPVQGAINTGPLEITSINHGLVTGQKVTIAGVVGNTAANGTFTITVIDSNHFTLNGTHSNGTYVSGGTWTSSLAGVVTQATKATPIVITSPNHGLHTGLTVTVVGVGGNTAANGTWVVTVIDNNHFSLNGSTGNANYTSGGSWTESQSGTVKGAADTGPITITSAGHGLATGMEVTVSGVQGNTAANGTYIISVVDKDHFSLFGTASNGTYVANTGTWSVATNSAVYFAGTNRGELFATYNGGQWERVGAATLPLGSGVKIDGITVDPRDNNNVYVLLGGTGFTGHIWGSTDGGQTWQNITANLPDVSAYALAVDPVKTVPAPNGKLFVATDAGLFVSSDNGSSWQAFGQGLPNVPIVGLQLDLRQNVLVAATQGRGTFTIQIDDAGPRVATLSHNLTDSFVTVTFNEAIDPNTLTTSQLTLTGPTGIHINVSQLTVTPVANDPTSFEIDFPFNLAPGAYRLTIAQTVTDVMGNEMDQNQNFIQGEVPGDVYSGRFIYQSYGNNAPVLGKTTTTLPQTTEDGANPGVKLTTLIAGLNITDADKNALKGIAITSIPVTTANSYGTWQYSRDNGVTWASFNSVTPTHALLLENVANDLIRFVPTVEFVEASIQPSFTYRAWDLTTDLSSFNGSDGSFGDTTNNGGLFPNGTAYSAAQGTATETVLSDNPTFTVTQAQVNVLPTSTPIQQTFASFLTNISAGPIEPASSLTLKLSNNNPGLFTTTGQPAISVTDGTLTFTPKANAHGAATITVTLSDGDDATVKSFVISVDHPPVLQTIPDQSFPHTQSTYTVNLEPTPGSTYGSDADAGDTLTFSATVTGYSLPYQVQFVGDLPGVPVGGLQLAEGKNGLGQLSYLTNSKGFQEKWLVAPNQGNARYFLLVNGDLYKWNGQAGLLTSTLIAQLGAAVYKDPTLLTNAQAPAAPPISASVNNSNANRPLTFTLTSPFAGNAFVTVTLTDGIVPVRQTFLLTVTNSAPTLGTIPQQQMSHNLGGALNPLPIDLNNYGLGGNTDGDPLAFQTQVSAFSLPYELQYGNAAPNVPQGLYLFQQGNTYTPITGIAGAKWLRSATDHNWYFILPSGAFYRWVGNGDFNVSHSTKIATLGTSVYANPTLLTNAQAPSLPAGFTGVTTTSVDPSGQFIVNTDGTFTGTLKISVQVSDTDNADTVTFNTVSRSFQLDVINFAPVISSIPDQTAAHGSTSLPVDLSSYVSDPDNDALTINPPVLKGVGGAAAPPVTAVVSGTTITFTLNNSGGTTWAGTFQVTVTASDTVGAKSAPQTFQVTFPNAAPNFNNAPGDQTIHHDTASSPLDISASDSDGDTVNYSASVSQQAFTVSTVWPQNYGGQNEKWFTGPKNQFGRFSYFLKTDGELWAWNGTAHQDTGALVAQLDASVWSTPSLLTNPGQPKPANSWVDLTDPSNVIITPGANFVGVFQVKFTASDGFSNGAINKTIWVTVTNSAVGLGAIANQTMATTAGSTLSVPLNVTNTDNDTLTWTVTTLGQAASLQQTYGFIEQKDPNTGQPSFFFNMHHLNEKWVYATRGIVVGQSPWFCILPNGNMYEMVNGNPTGKFIASIGTTYYNDPTQLFNSTSQPGPDVSFTETQDGFGNWSLNLTLNSDYAGTFVVTVKVSDGPSSATRTFNVN